MSEASVLSSPLPRIAAIVLAAGASRRMRGEDKLLRTISRVPLIRRAALAALNSECCETIVVLQPHQSRRARCISDLPAQIIFSRRAFAGMAMSLRSGIAAVSAPANGAVISLADMPEIDSEDLNALIRAFKPGRIVAAGVGGLPGNPVLLPKELFAELSQLTGDIGARAVIKRHIQLMKMADRPGNRARVDLDTPEDWDEWLAGKN